MTTTEAAAALRKQGLLPWFQEGTDYEQVRRVWMSPTLISRINVQKVASNNDAIPEDVATQIQSYLLSFTLGDDMSVGAHDDRCDLKTMSPPKGKPYEAWEMRITPGRPKTRIFGGFVTEYDFVAAEIWLKGSFAKSGKNTQDNVANRSILNIKGLVRGRVLSCSTCPRAEDLGGERCGYYDYE